MSDTTWTWLRVIYVPNPRLYRDIKVTDTLTGESKDRFYDEVKKVVGDDFTRVYAPLTYAPQDFIVAVLPDE